MAQVYLVSPALVRKTEELLARVKRGPASEEYIHDWIARVDASAARLQPTAGVAPARAQPPDGQWGVEKITGYNAPVAVSHFFIFASSSWGFTGFGI